MKIVAEIGLSAGREGRLAHRLPVEVSAVVRRQGETGAKAVVLDLSTDGFKAEVASSLPVGTYVWLRLPGLSPLDARVAWCDGIHAGAQFVTALHPAVVERVIAAS